MGEVIQISRGRRKRRGPCWRIAQAGYHILQIKKDDGWHAVAVVVRGADGFWWYAIPGRGVSGRTIDTLPVIKRALFERVAEGP